MLPSALNCIKLVSNKKLLACVQSIPASLIADSGTYQSFPP